MPKQIDSVMVGDLGTNCWLYRLDEAAGGTQPCVVIDPGDEAELIVSRLRELNWKPDFILLTHGHFDHLAGLPDLVEACGRDSGSPPKIAIHRLDAQYLGKDSLAVHRESLSAAGGSGYVDALWKPMPAADFLFEEGDAIGPFRVLHLPGHTPGSAAFYDEKRNVLFSGDTLFRGTWGRTDLPGGNEGQIFISLKRLLSMKGEIVACPGHGPATTIAEEAAGLKALL